MRGDGCKLSGDLEEENEERRKLRRNHGPEGRSEGNFVHQTGAIANGASSPEVRDRAESERKRGADDDAEAASAGETTSSSISPKQRGIQDVDAEDEKQNGAVLKEALPSSTDFSAKMFKESGAVDAKSDRERSLKIGRPAAGVGGRRAKIVVDGATVSFQAIGYEIDYEIARIVGTPHLMYDSVVIHSVVALDCFLEMAHFVGTFLPMCYSIMIL